MLWGSTKNTLRISDLVRSWNSIFVTDACMNTRWNIEVRKLEAKLYRFQNQWLETNHRVKMLPHDIVSQHAALTMCCYCQLRWFSQICHCQAPPESRLGEKKNRNKKKDINRTVGNNTSMCTSYHYHISHSSTHFFSSLLCFIYGESGFL